MLHTKNKKKTNKIIYKFIRKKNYFIVNSAHTHFIAHAYIFVYLPRKNVEYSLMCLPTYVRGIRVHSLVHIVEDRHIHAIFLGVDI